MSGVRMSSSQIAADWGALLSTSTVSVNPAFGATHWPLRSRNA